MLAFVFLLSAAAAGFVDYTPATYPDSLINHAACNIPEPGLICDPNGIFNKTTQLHFIHKLVNSQNKTQCKCGLNSEGQCDSSNLGFVFSIALVDKMTLNDDENDRQSILKAAEQFADQVRERQNRGHCKDDLLIFISRTDQVVWTSIGKTTEFYLTNQMITSITTSAEDVYFIKGEFGNGLDYMIDSFIKVLNGDKLELAKKPFYSPLPLWAFITICVVSGIILLVCLGLAIFACVRCCKKDGRGNYTMGQRM